MNGGTIARLLVAVPCLAGTAHAGQTCEQRPLSAHAIEQGMALAWKTSQALDAEHARSGARVVLLARAGQDLSAHRLRYSHLGWVFNTPEGPWRVLHKLNLCGTATADIHRQGLGDFFLGPLWRHEAAWVVPAPALQAPLLALLDDHRRALALHTRAYNMVSYPWSQRYQQSNQWAIETMTLALEPGIGDREQAQSWLRFKGYQPTTLHLGALTRLGARMSRANVAFDDHPNDKRFSDRIETMTVDSVFDWLPRIGLTSSVQTLALHGTAQ